MAHTVQHEEFESYTGMYGFTKKKADVVLVGSSGSKKPIGYIKGEPVMNEAGKQVTWVYYYKGHHMPKAHPNHFTSPRAIVKFLQEHYTQVDADNVYEKAANYTPTIGAAEALEKALADPSMAGPAGPAPEVKSDAEKAFADAVDDKDQNKK
jgi:hypothetical protein